MALNIKNPKAHKLAEELAAVTGESLTTTVVKALEERLARVRQSRRKKSLAEELNEIGRQLSKCPVYDDRSLEEMLYDEQGLPK